MSVYVFYLSSLPLSYLLLFINPNNSIFKYRITGRDEL